MVKEMFLKIIVLVTVLLAAEKTPVALAHLGEHKIVVTEDGFSPENLGIEVDEIVTFVNEDRQDHWPASNVHPTHQVYSDFDPKKPIELGQSWSFKFDKEGHWGFHDHLYPENTGTIIVGSKTDAVQQSKNPNFFQRLQDLFKDFLGKIYARFSSSKLASSSISDFSTEFKEPNAYNLSSLENSFDCASSDYSCTSEKLIDITKEYGPKAAIELLVNLQKSAKIQTSLDDHHLAHLIGRQTSKSFGVGPKAFLLCPTDYNYGCQHGYFEFVLGKTDSTKEVAELICEEIDESYPPKSKFYCYHGLGHGVMMAAAYDLNGSLDTCNSLGSDLAADGCWQGVFMENVNGAMRGEAREGVFSETDPLAPCNRLDQKYQHECLINHAGYLMNYFNNDVSQATRACLAAPEAKIISCMQSIGLMATNPVWQVNLSKNAASLSFTEVAWELCRRFPSDYVDECVNGGIDNIMNFDQLDLDRAEKFCSTVSGNYRSTCFRKIGSGMSVNTTDTNLVRQKCLSLGQTYGQVCLEGAGISSNEI